MLSKTLFLSVLLTVIAMTANTMAAPNTTQRTLYSFNDPDSVRQWQTVNDGVMGGRSDGRVVINEFKNLEFFGTLSLANNGGFASVRSRGTALNLRNGDAIGLKVRGDGRKYSLNLYTASRLTAFSYRATFQTLKDEWIDVTIPVSEFVATSFGRVISGVSLSPESVSGIGVLLGDKKPGPFRLEIDAITIKPSN